MIDARKKLKTAIIWFVSLLTLVLIFAIGNALNGSGNNATILIVGIFLLGVPIFLSFIRGCEAIKRICLCKKNGYTIPTSMWATSVIVALQIPLFCVILMASSIVKPMIATQKVANYFSERHKDDYEILQSCHHFDESVNDYTKVVFKLDAFEDPVTAKYVWNRGIYEDDYEVVKSGGESDLPKSCDSYQ